MFCHSKWTDHKFRTSSVCSSLHISFCSGSFESTLKSKCLNYILYESLCIIHVHLRVTLYAYNDYIPQKKIVICGDININYLDSHNRKQQLDTLLAMNNLKSTVNFPTRIFNGSSTAIDNIFDWFIKKFYYKSPLQWVVRSQRLATNIRKRHCTDTRIHILLC